MVDTRFYAPLGPVSLGDLIQGLDIEPLTPGFADQLIESGGGLAQSTAGQISFLNSKKYLSQLETAGATACFVPEELAASVGQANIIPLVSKFPRAHFGRILPKLCIEHSFAETGQVPSDSLVLRAIHRQPLHDSSARLRPGPSP